MQTTPEVSVDENSPGPRMARIARMATKKKKQGKWSHLVEATKHAKAAFTRSRSEDSLSSSEHRNDSRSSSSSSRGDSERPIPMKIMDLPVFKRSLFARKLGNLALSTSRLRLAFMDISPDSHQSVSKNRVGDSSADREQAQRTVSAPFSQWMASRSTSMDYLGKTMPAGGQMSSARSLSPIPSCASSNVPTPRSSITGHQDTTSQKEPSLPASPHPRTSMSRAYGIETVSNSTTTGWI